MKLNKLFASFKRKLVLEGVLRSFFPALAAAGISAFVFSLVYHILLEKTPVAIMAVICGGIFAVTFLTVFFARYFPTMKKIASRVDGIGLKERASTMLDNSENSSSMASMQREDAVIHIKKAAAKDMKIYFSRKMAVLCAISVFMAALMLSLPHDILSFAEPKDENELKQEQIIKDMIEELREEVKNSQLEEELKDKIDEIIDKLEEDIEKTDSTLEQVGKIEEAKKEISDLLEKELTKNKIGEALQKYELTKALGLAISSGDTEKVSLVLDGLEIMLKQNKELVKELAETVKKALEESGVEAGDELYDALYNFAESLEKIDIQGTEFEKELGEIFDKAEEEINAALEKQKIIESEKEKLEDIMSGAKEELLENKEGEEGTPQTGEGGKEPGEGEEGQGEQPGGNQPGGDQPGGNQPGGDKPGGDKPGDGEGGDKGTDGGDYSGEDDRTEGIYDPISGKVSYGEVFAVYYAEYLKAIEKGNVPEYLQEIMDIYFAELN